MTGRKKSSTYAWRWIAVMIGLLVLGSTKVEAAHISYLYSVDEKLTSLDYGGVTVTGSDKLLLNHDNGLTVDNGFPDFPFREIAVDPSESLVFRFNDGPVTGISLELRRMVSWDWREDQSGGSPVLSGQSFVTAFDQAGQALGTHEITPFGSVLGISQAFGNVPISSFLLRPKGDIRAGTFIQVGGLTYSPVPEPSTMALFGFVVLAAGIRKLGRRSALAKPTLLGVSERELS